MLAGDAEAREEEYMAGGPYTGPLTLIYVPKLHTLWAKVPRLADRGRQPGELRLTGQGLGVGPALPSGCAVATTAPADFIVRAGRRHLSHAVLGGLPCGTDARVS